MTVSLANTVHLVICFGLTISYLYNHELNRYLISLCLAQINHLDITVAWDMAIFSVPENGGSLMACVVVTAGNLCRDIEVLVSTADSTATPQAIGMIIRIR